VTKLGSTNGIPASSGLCGLTNMGSFGSLLFRLLIPVSVVAGGLARVRVA
jgi:hypothetical protein